MELFVRILRASLVLLLLVTGAFGAAAGPEAVKIVAGCRIEPDTQCPRADLRNADLTEAVLMRANLRGAQLDGADLRGADLTSGNLSQASLRGADLSGAILRGVDFNRSDLSGTILQGANLALSNLQAARLDGTMLEGANLLGATWLDGRSLCAPGSIGECRSR